MQLDEVWVTEVAPQSVQTRSLLHTPLKSSVQLDYKIVFSCFLRMMNGGMSDSLGCIFYGLKILAAETDSFIVLNAFKITSKKQKMCLL